ncbi:ABC transporter ATP-binding protein [Haloarcula sp. S1AR25-5A]|uniref:Molybdate/tungstate import ATP-binding protein WtpC n=1 Tax=Haloarcula terrestris TaxID=2950533 RepID=A0AAE4EYB5_9EURY|nr:ABC transporter ATP-binding protein [Haloarcula terrestris]MDS0222420.1 ABC transporter ATP-binding protein [Haloarcula terrestris]
MIEFENVTKQYPDGTVAIEDISFSVEEGTTTVLVGPSGCGKTTTMKLVNRLEDPTEGTVYVNGADNQELDKIELRRDVGYVIQEIGLFDHLTVAENVATVPDLEDWEQERIDDRVDELLELMGLPPEDYRESFPDELSGGQRQRIGVARALAADPDVLLMDEPFGALDPITRERLQNEFLDIQSRINTTIIFVTHSIDEALKMGDKIAIYNVGEVVQYDTPQNILANPATEFVEDFIGDNQTFKQLDITLVSEVMEPLDGGESAVADTEPLQVAADGGDGPPAVAADATLKTALTRLLATDTVELPVVGDDDVVGTISERHIRDYFQPEKTGGS